MTEQMIAQGLMQYIAQIRTGSVAAQRVRLDVALFEVQVSRDRELSGFFVTRRVSASAKGS